MGCRHRYNVGEDCTHYGCDSNNLYRHAWEDLISGRGNRLDFPSPVRRSSHSMGGYRGDPREALYVYLDTLVPPEVVVRTADSAEPLSRSARVSLTHEGLRIAMALAGWAVCRAAPDALDAAGLQSHATELRSLSPLTSDRDVKKARNAAHNVAREFMGHRAYDDIHSIVLGAQSVAFMASLATDAGARLRRIPEGSPLYSDHCGALPGSIFETARSAVNLARRVADGRIVVSLATMSERQDEVEWAQQRVERSGSDG